MNVINKLIAVQQHSRLLFYSFLKATPFRGATNNNTWLNILLLSVVVAIDLAIEIAAIFVKPLVFLMEIFFKGFKSLNDQQFN